MSLSKDLYDRFVGSLGQGPLVKPDTFFFGTVTSLRPVKVQLEGDDTPVASQPIMMARDAVVGSRVLCQLHGRQLIVVSVVRDVYQDPDPLDGVMHLDNLTDTHVWHQGANVDASTSRGYPADLAGLLEVTRGVGSMVYQRYTPYNGTGVYSRASYNGAWSPWTLAAAAPASYDISGTISTNFSLSGRITVRTNADGKREAVYNVRITRINSNFGQLSQVNWTLLGVLVPAGARISGVLGHTYTTGWISATGSTVGATFPVSIYLNQTTGEVSIKATYGLNTVINTNDFINLYLVLSEA